MRVVDHRLDDEQEVEHVDTPNQGGVIVPRYLVIHYTAGRSGASSVAHFQKAAAKASAHVVIDRSGEIWQLVPFNVAAWHAGASSWAGLTGLNRYSIGIELDNAGLLKKVGIQYQAWFGKLYPEQEVIQARHKFGTDLEYWHAFPEVQIQALLTVTEALFAAYALEDIVGHDDIAPQRKVDPGPAFPMRSFRAQFIGRQDDSGERYRVTTPLLNVRSGPGTEYPTVMPPLAGGAVLTVLEMRALWANVLLVGGTQRLGWVRNSFIAPA